MPYKKPAHTIATTVLTAAISLCFLAAVPAKAETNATRTIEYTITIDGDHAGSQKATWTQGAEGTTNLHSHVAIELLFSQYTVDSRLTWDHDQLKSVSINKNDDGEISTIICNIAEKCLRLTAKDNKGRPFSSSFPTPDYDIAYQRLPDYLAQKHYPKNDQQLRIMDFESGTVIPALVSVKGQVKISKGTDIFSCTKVQFSADDMKAALWIAEDTFGAFVVREENESELGKTVLELKNYSLGTAK